MKTGISIEQLLRWRRLQAEAEAPPAPRAARLLEMARPWWEKWPEQFQSLVARLGKIQVAYGHAMAEAHRPRIGHPVSTLVVYSAEEVETFLRVLYLTVRNGRLRLRVQLDATLAAPPESFEATFVADPSARPLLSAAALLSTDGEYRIDTVICEELAQAWENLKVTDRMPFRLILRADKDSVQV